MKNQHKILVCSSCATVWQDKKRVGISGGEKLLKKLTQQAKNWSRSQEFSIESVKCMSAYSHHCVIAFTASGKYTYVFGNLSHDVESIPHTSAAVLDCANLYYQKPDGIIPRSERPEALRKGIIARIPHY